MSRKVSVATLCCNLPNCKCTTTQEMGNLLSNCHEFWWSWQMKDLNFSIPISVKGKQIVCLLKWRECPWIFCPQTMRLGEYGKWTTETEQKSDTEHYHHLTILSGIVFLHTHIYIFVQVLTFIKFSLSSQSNYVVNFTSNPRRWKEGNWDQKNPNSFSLKKRSCYSLGD